jgi:hypothetical protein
MRQDRRRELAVGCLRQHTSAYVSIRQHTSAYELAVGCASVEKRWRSVCPNLARREVVGSKVSSKVSSKVHACVEERWRSVCEHLARHEVVRLKRSWHVVRACVSRLLR